MVGGPIVMQGYFGNEAKIKETIEPDGWLHTGDVARMDEAGPATWRWVPEVLTSACALPGSGITPELRRRWWRQRTPR